MKNKYFILCVLFFILTSCLPIKQSKIPTKTNFNKNSENGLIIGTVTFTHPKNKSPYNKYMFHLSYNGDNVEENKNNTNYFTVNVNQFNNRFNGEMNENKTYPFVLEQKSGKYSLDGYSFIWHGGYITKDISNSVKFSLPINVEKAKIAYIGNLIINQKTFENPMIEITDKLDSDFNYFKNEYKNIDWSLLKNSTITSGNNGNGFIKLNK